MTRNEAEALLSTLHTYENACAADMEREWIEAKRTADMADYDERNVIDCDASTLDDAGVEDLVYLDNEQYS